MSSQKKIDNDSSTTGNPSESEVQDDANKIIDWITQLREPTTRENALMQLSKKRESFPDLAIYLWYSPGIISALLQELISTYSLLAPPTLSSQESNHTCNVLALFQCIAAHQETRANLLKAQIPIFLYPFLNTLNKNKPFEYLRLTALGVIGALVKVDNSEVIGFLISTEIIPLCLRIMERGSELSKTVATFIVQRILLDEKGLSYVCDTAERFYAVSSVLNNMANTCKGSRVIKHVIRCFARFSENQRVCNILKENIPPCFKDKSFYETLDEGSKKWIQAIQKNCMNSIKANITLSPGQALKQEKLNLASINSLQYNNPNSGIEGTGVDSSTHSNLMIKNSRSQQMNMANCNNLQYFEKKI